MKALKDQGLHLLYLCVLRSGGTPSWKSMGLFSEKASFMRTISISEHAPVRLLSQSVDVQDLQEAGQREDLMERIVYADSLDASAAVLHLLRAGEKNAQSGRRDVIDL